MEWLMWLFVIVPVAVILYFAVYPPAWLREKGWRGEWDKQDGGRREGQDSPRAKDV